MWVSPFRHSRVNGYLLLTVTFRSLSRLSSALSAKASTLRSLQLNQFLFFIRFCLLKVFLPVFGCLFVYKHFHVYILAFIIAITIDSAVNQFAFSVQFSRYVSFLTVYVGHVIRKFIFHITSLAQMFFIISGSHLLSHAVSSIVPSAV